MKRVDTVVIGTVVTEGSVLADSCVAIDGGKIVGVLSADAVVEAGERIECPGCLIMPGIVDAHVHGRGLPSEGFTNVTRAAAAGGVTTIVDMPGDPGQIVDNAEAFDNKVRLGEAECLVDFALWAAATPHNLDQFEGLARAGAVGFKMFMAEGRTLGHMDDGRLLDAFQEIARLGSIAAVHPESYEITTYLAEKFRKQGRVGPEMHLPSRPDAAEFDAVMRGSEFARLTGVDLHFCHISLARCVDYITRQRLDYPRLSLETCPQYLSLTEETLQQIGAFGKINPPLRKAGEPEAMWEQVRLGRIDLIGSDHSPHQAEAKTAPNIFDNKAGMSGVETMLPVLFTEGVMKRQLPVEQIVSLITSAPARRFGMYPQKGALLPGSDADLAVVDPKAEWEITADKLHQAAGWTAYEGMKVIGKAVLTMVRGQAVYRDGEIVGKPGIGSFVPSARRPQ